MWKILVSGSIAYDYIMDFPDQFGKYILPDKTDKLSVNFNINKLEKRNGWAGHNIAYNLWLLGEKALLMWAVGEDFEASEKNKNMIDYRYAHISKSLGTPSAYIITDMENNQITAFYPWASVESGQQSIKEVKEQIVYAIISPNNPATMLKHLLECKELWIPVIFDPGQPLSAFTKEQLHRALQATTSLIVNEYELNLLCKLAEVWDYELLHFVENYIVTLGAEWSTFIGKDETFTIPSVPVEKVLDPTGAGDAYRAWVLWALKYNKWRKEGMEMWSKLASACVQKYGTQEHEIIWKN